MLDEVDNELQTTEIKDYISDNILLIFFVFVSTRAVLQLFSCLNMMHVFEHFVPFYHRKNLSVCTLSLWVQVLDSDWSTALATTPSNIKPSIYIYITYVHFFTSNMENPCINPNMYFIYILWGLFNYLIQRKSFWKWNWREIYRANFPF